MKPTLSPKKPIATNVKEPYQSTHCIECINTVVFNIYSQEQGELRLRILWVTFYALLFLAAFYYL